MKLKKLLTLLLTLTLLSAGLVYAVNTVSTGFRVGTPQKTIDAHGVCKKVSKKSVLDIFVPTKTSIEWSTFISNGIDVANLEDCSGSSTCTDTTWKPSASRMCLGISFTQTSNCNRTRQKTGTKDCSICTDTTWLPLTGTVCSPILFNQTSNCNRTRQKTGTKDCNTCTDTQWSPGTNTVCSGNSFTQTSNCGNTRTRTGTKSCNTPVDCDGGWSNTSTCNGGFLEEIYTLTQAGLNGGDISCPTDGTTRVGTTSCNEPIDCSGIWSDTTTCSETCGGGFLEEIYTLTQAGLNGGDISCPADGTTRVGTTTCNTQSCGIPGSCGNANGLSTLNAPTTGLCSNGTTPSAVTGNGTWYWTCNGIDGSTVNESCESYKKCYKNISDGGGAGGNAYGYYDYYYNLDHLESGNFRETCDAGTPTEAICEPVEITWNVSCNNGNVTETFVSCTDGYYADGSYPNDNACDPTPTRPMR